MNSFISSFKLEVSECGSLKLLSLELVLLIETPTLLCEKFELINLSTCKLKLPIE